MNSSKVMLSTSDVTGLMQDVVHQVSPTVDYLDCLYTNFQTVRITKDSTEENLSQPFSTRGLVFRMFKKGAWREAAFSDLDDKTKICEETRNVARFSPTSNDTTQEIAFQKPWKTSVELFGEKDPRDIEAKEKLEVVRKYYDVAKNCDTRIINVNSLYNEHIDERVFVNSEGSELFEILCRIYLGITSLAREGDRIEYDYVFNGRTGGFEIAETLFNEESALSTAKGAIELLNSHQVPNGTFNVVLDPGMTGTFAHESFGHGCEADQVLRGRSYLVNYLNKKLGPDNFSLYDDGTLSEGVGSLVFDDEGTPPHKTPIIENGVLVHFLHDRTTSKEMKDKPTGNARRESYKRMIYVRMTNTYTSEGDFALEELLRETKDGLLLEKWNSGIEDPIGGNMQLKCKKSWRIKNGEKVEPFSTTVLSGKVLDFMANITGTSRASDFIIDAGHCGKGQGDMVTVGSGGTYLASRATIGQG